MNYYNIDNPSDVRELSEQMEQWLADGNPKANDWAEQPPAPTDNAQWVDGQWVIPPPPTYTIGQWLEKVNLGPSQQPTLVYLKLNLQLANKTSTKLNCLEEYLNSMLIKFTENLEPKNDWGYPPYSYFEVVSECVDLLKKNN